MPPPTADLSGWSGQPYAAAGLTYEVYKKGTGPGVVLMPEVPGIHPAVLALGNYLVAKGFTVVIPSLFGTPGKPRGGGYALRTIARLCVTREFMAFATDGERPIAKYIRALASDLNNCTPGRGVGVIGMCFTGGFALAAAVDGSVLASVLSQPAVPFPLIPAQRRDPGLSDNELDVVIERARSGEVCALGLRFSADRMVPPERFATLSERLGSAFEIIPLDSSPGNPYNFGRSAHSVLTDEVREQAGHPAFEARERVVAFLTERLIAPSDLDDNGGGSTR
jgi:dienelactone hydrolase